MDYKSLKQLYDRARDKDKGKPIANNTRVVREGDCFAIRLHATIIISVDQNNIFTLNTGGWLTRTTKERLNRYSPATIRQVKGQWYIGNTLYFDGIKVNLNGDILNALSDADKKKKEKYFAKMTAKINRYCRDFQEHINAGKLVNPSGGDCWYCSMRTDDNDSLGDAFKDHTHLLNHIDESYFVPSLLYNAIKEHGYSEPSLIFCMARDKHIDIKDHLRKYLKKRLLRRRII